ncbi:unnamed protein product [Thelazia callipaeda]|uniref:Uncharacterized protein n=1 Tax=Thelazia callipaeda TaxID=103827 RepID=A0A0N5D6V9_THECL|nr:unnamed protein product [Thelazia callipaeda]
MMLPNIQMFVLLKIKFLAQNANEVELCKIEQSGGKKQKVARMKMRSDHAEMVSETAGGTRSENEHTLDIWFDVICTPRGLCSTRHLSNSTFWIDFYTLKFYAEPIMKDALNDGYVSWRSQLEMKAYFFRTGDIFRSCSPYPS